MNEHAGPASALSVLIVGVFAILLHQPDRPTTSMPTPAPPKLAPTSTPSDPPATKPVALEKPAPPKDVAKLTPEVPKREAQPAPPSQVVVVPQAKPQLKEPLASRPAPAPITVPLQPKRPFTVVKPGEKLMDVARRIYGNVEATEALWRANRDQVAQADSRLEEGTVLRTP